MTGLPAASVARVVLIGPEASGKTTLARELAEEFNAPWTPEAARLFAETWPEPLSLATVAPIARLSMRLEDEALAGIAATDPATVSATAAESAPRPLLVRDTDLVSTVVYSRHYYGVVEEWIEREARARRGDLYLLCRPDLPWFPDGVRDRPDQRERLYEDFRLTLRSMDARIADVSGAGEARRMMAREAVESLMLER